MSVFGDGGPRIIPWAEEKGSKETFGRRRSVREVLPAMGMQQQGLGDDGLLEDWWGEEKRAAAAGAALAGGNSREQQQRSGSAARRHRRRTT